MQEEEEAPIVREEYAVNIPAPAINRPLAGVEQRSTHWVLDTNTLLCIGFGGILVGFVIYSLALKAERHKRLLVNGGA